MSVVGQHPSHRDVAVAALLDRHGRLLMVRTRRLPHHWQPVGGGQHAHDPSPRATVAREVGEEFGLHLHPDEFIYQLRTPYDFGDGEVHFYTAQLPDTAVLEANHQEIVEYRWVALDDALRLDTYPATRQFLRHLTVQRSLAPSTPDEPTHGSPRKHRSCCHP